MLQKRIQEDKCSLSDTTVLENLAYDLIFKWAIFLGAGIRLYLVLKVIDSPHLEGIIQVNSL